MAEFGKCPHCGALVYLDEEEGHIGHAEPECPKFLEVMGGSRRAGVLDVDTAAGRVKYTPFEGNA